MFGFTEIRLILIISVDKQKKCQNIIRVDNKYIIDEYCITVYNYKLYRHLSTCFYYKDNKRVRTVSNMPLSPQQQYIEQAILQQELQRIDLSNDKILQIFISYVQNLQINAKGLRIIRTLIRAYGLPVVIFLRNFYQRVRKQQNRDFVKKQEKMIAKLATAASQESNHKCIQYIQYMFQLSPPNRNTKQLQMEQIDIDFIQLVQKIQQYNSEIRELSKTGQRTQLAQKIQFYNNFKREAIKNNSLYDFQKIMIKALQRIVISNNQLSQMLAQSHKRQTNAIQQKQKIQALNSHTQNQMISRISISNQSSSLNSSILSNPSQMQDHYKIYMKQESKQQQRINNGTQQIENTFKNRQLIKLQQKRRRYLCCQTYFYFQQQIIEKQSLTVAYLHAPYPFRKEKMDDMRKIICSFLNQDGGILYVGFAYEKQSWIVIGNQISEGEKQNIWRTLRQICQSIQPDILTNKMYHVDFVPIKDLKTNQYIVGNFVIKIIVKYGVRDQIYSYKDNKFDYFPFRCGAEVIFKQGRQVIKQIKDRTDNIRPVPTPLHSYMCLKPETGQPLIKYYQDPIFIKKKDNQFFFSTGQAKEMKNGYMSKQQIIQSHRVNKSPEKDQQSSPPKVSPFIVHFDSQSPKITHKIENHNIQNNTKTVLKGLADIRTKQKLQPKQLKWSYFYISGLTQKQIQKLFQKLNNSAIKIEQCQPGFSIKVFEEQTKAKVKKIFKKIVEKYAQRQIQFYELSLQIEVQSLNKILVQLKKIGLDDKAYKVVTGNRVRFKFFKDSLRVFLALKQNNIYAEFIHEK